MNEDWVKLKVASATSQLAVRFERFIQDNRALLTQETEQQLAQVIGDLQRTSDLLGVAAQTEPDQHADALGEELQSYAVQFDNKDSFLSSVNEIAAASYDAAQS